uniref:XRE family transcriptional regulator n=1 Tax=Desulfobacca acetoxidans TaxID=60893 RepID=A0A7V6DPH9_9BACT
MGSRIYAVFPTQADFSKVVWIRESRLSRIVRGRVTPSPEKVWRLCEVLRVAPEELFPNEY